jgi:hypothetical protein
MKSLSLGLISLFLLMTGVLCSTDLVMVLAGYKGEFNSYPQYGLEWWNSPIFGYNISRSANVLMGAMGFMAFFGLFFYCQMFIHSLKDKRPISILNLLIISLGLFCLSSCATVMPKTKKDCKGIKHYRQSNGVYVKCDQGHTHIDSTVNQTKFFRPKYSLTH